MPSPRLDPDGRAASRLLSLQSDRRLVELVRAGRDQAFEAIVRRYRPALLSYCRRLAPPGQHEDAVQHAFLVTYQALRAEDREINLRGWLFRVARNAAFDSRREARREEPELPDSIGGAEDPTDVVGRRERLRECVAALRRLPRRQRRALVLRELEGRGYDEIAARMDSSEAAARQLVRRARAALRAGATALVPYDWLLRWLAPGAASPAESRIPELAGGGAAAAAAKTAVTLALAGGVALGGGGLPSRERVRPAPPREHVRIAPAAPPPVEPAPRPVEPLAHPGSAHAALPGPVQSAGRPPPSEAAAANEAASGRAEQLGQHGGGAQDARDKQQTGQVDGGGGETRTRAGADETARSAGRAPSSPTDHKG